MRVLWTNKRTCVAIVGTFVVAFLVALEVVNPWLGLATMLLLSASGSFLMLHRHRSGGAMNGLSLLLGRPVAVSRHGRDEIARTLGLVSSDEMARQQHVFRALSLAMPLMTIVLGLCLFGLGKLR